jgi:hypothetical protein
MASLKMLCDQSSNNFHARETKNIYLIENEGTGAETLVVLVEQKKMPSTLRRRTRFGTSKVASGAPASRPAKQEIQQKWAHYIKVIIKEEPPQNFLPPSRPA